MFALGDGSHERLSELDRRLMAILWIALHRFGEHALDRWCIELWIDLAQRNGLTPQTRDDHLLLRAALEWQSAGNHLVRHERQRIDVAPCVDRLAAKLLGTHKSRRAEDDAGRCELTELGIRRAFLCQSEVHNHRVLRTARALAQHDVFRLQIAVHDIELMRDVETNGDVSHERRGVIERDAAKTVGAVRQYLA